MALLVAYVISFYNISDLASLNNAFQFTLIFIACVLMFYLIVNNLRSERDLKRFHTFQAVSLATILLLAVYELNNPGRRVHPRLDRIHADGRNRLQHAKRACRRPVPSTTKLLSEFCAISLLLVGFMVIRATNVTTRALLIGLGTLCAFILFATVTRGSFIALGSPDSRTSCGPSDGGRTSSRSRSCWPRSLPASFS